jgi:metal-responsive CopG/Arc/MetJ family transcriptional regulator
VADAVRIHIVIDADTVSAVDRLVGKRGRSRFAAEALREKLVREDQGRALSACAGVIDLSRYPEWQTPEDVSRWVRESRRLDDQRADEASQASGRS